MRIARRGALALALAVTALTIAYWPRQIDDPASANPMLAREDYKSFFGADYYGIRDFAAAATDVDQLPGFGDSSEMIASFVRRYGLERARVLEVGAGAGRLQDAVADYTGLDIAPGLARFYRKPFVAASATAMPFADDAFDAIWTIGTLQSVPKPEQALSEMRRVLKDGGLLLLHSGWQCRPWAADGYEVRPWSDFGIDGKLVKASIPLRDSVAYRALYTMPIRALRHAGALASGTPTAFRYTLLAPNYAQFWQSESEAVNSMDPYEAILWFTSRGDEVLEYEGAIHPIFVRTGAFVVRVRKEPRR